MKRSSRTCLLLLALGLMAMPAVAAKARLRSELHEWQSNYKVEEAGEHPKSISLEIVVPELASKLPHNFLFFTNRFWQGGATKDDQGRVRVSVDRFRDGLFIDRFEEAGQIEHGHIAFDDLPEDLLAGDRLAVTFGFRDMPMLEARDAYALGAVFEAGGSDRGVRYPGVGGFWTETHEQSSRFEIETRGKHPRQLQVELVVPEVPELTESGLLRYGLTYFRDSSRSKGNVKLRLDVLRDGSVIETHREERPIESGSIFLGTLPVDFQSGDRLRATLKFKKMPRLRESEEFYVGWTSFVLREEPSRTFKTKVDEVLPFKPFDFVGNPAPLDFYGVCNAEEFSVWLYFRFFGRRPDGSRFWITPRDFYETHNSPAFVRRFRAGDCTYDFLDSGSILAGGSFEPAVATGIQAVFGRVLTIGNDFSQVIKRIEFEGDRYCVQWLRPGDALTCPTDADGQP